MIYIHGEQAGARNVARNNARGTTRENNEPEIRAGHPREIRHARQTRETHTPDNIAREIRGRHKSEKHPRARRQEQLLPTAGLSDGRNARETRQETRAR